MLTVQKRIILGKNIKRLRREGILPANIYGKGLASTAVQVLASEFQIIYKEVGETGLVDLQLDGKTLPVLIKNVSADHQAHMYLHADFFKVNLKEKVKTMVPLVIIGEAKAVSENTGLLLQQLNEVEVEALPADLPENIEVSVEHLAELAEQITVAELKVPKEVTILTDPGQTVVKIGELVTAEAEADAAAEEAVSEAAHDASDGSEAVASEKNNESDSAKEN